MESIPLDFTETPAVEDNKYGEKMQFEASGPYQKTRTKTDFCWLVGFILYLVVWMIIIIYAFSTGNTSKGLKPRDSAGRICGYDSGVESKPYLVRYNSGRDYFVCLSECPQKNFDFAKFDGRSKRSTENQAQKLAEGNTSPKSDIEGDTPPITVPQNDDITENPTTMPTTKTTSTTTTTTTTTGSPSNDDDSSSKFDEAIKNIICQSDVNLDLIENIKKLRYFVERGKCSRAYNKTSEIYNDYLCGFNLTENKFEKFNQTSISTRYLSNAKYSIMGFIMLSGLIALLSIFLMRWYALAYVCISIFVICAAAFHFIYEKCVLNADSKTNGVLLALFLGVLALVVVVLVAIYFRKELCLACQMIKESCKAITCVLSSLAVPFLFFASYMMIFILGVCSYYLLSSLESPIYKVDLADKNEKCECPSSLGYSQNATCDPATFNSQCQQLETDAPCILSGCYMVGKRGQKVGLLHFINWLGLVWSFLFVCGFNDMVLASIFTTWYWTFNKKILSYLTVIESFWRITMYHLGTVALGSLIIAICTTVEAIVNSVKRSLRKSNRPCAAVILLSLQCLFNVVENLMEFINRRAYIMCAMHGTDFFQSARTAYYLFMRNKERVIGVVTATNCLTCFTNVLIACVTMQIARSYYAACRAEDLPDASTPLVIIFLGSYAICCMFMRVVEMAVGSVFVCFLEDTERNDGTNEKPYFMSEELTKFLYRK